MHFPLRANVSHFDKLSVTHLLVFQSGFCIETNRNPLL